MTEHKILIDTSCQLKLIHQTLCIRNINFEEGTFDGFTDISFLPLVVNLRQIRLNCSKQCRINRVTVQDSIDAAFVHEDLDALARSSLLNILSGEQCCVEELTASLSEHANLFDPNRNGGELLVKFPAEIFPELRDLKLVRICINFTLEKSLGKMQLWLTLNIYIEYRLYVEIQAEHRE